MTRSLELPGVARSTRNRSFVKVYRYRIPKRRLIATGLIAGNAVLLVVVALFVIVMQPSAPQNFQLQQPTAQLSPLDQLSSATIALTVARVDNLPESTPIANQADSETALLSVAPTTNSVVSKPQVVATSYVSNKDIKDYVVQNGDSIDSIAQKFNISANSILWSNNITGNAVTPGVHLLIPPVSGIVYTVKSGDTPASLASKYQADQNLIIAYNDAEIKGIYPGERIIIPNATEPQVIAYTAPAAAATYGWGGQATYGYNGYDVGYCTWWVAKLRAAAGAPLPTDLGNASTWALRAAAFGIPVGSKPSVGAAVVTSTSGEGHVAYVTGVNSDGTITISEMNHLGWDISDSRTIPAAGYQYIY